MTTPRKTYSRKNWKRPPTKTAIKRRPWTTAELLHIKLCWPNVSLTDRTQEAVYKAALRLGVVKPRVGVLDDEESIDEPFKHVWRTEWVSEPVKAACSVWEWRP